MFSIDHDVRTKPYTMPRTHFHEMYEIYYLVTGERDYFIEDRTYRITDGYIALINSYALHRTVDTGAQSHERYVINFSRRFLSMDWKTEWLLDIFSMTTKCIQVAGQDRTTVERLLQDMTTEFNKPKVGSRTYVKALFIQLLIILYRAYIVMDESELSGNAVQSHHIAYKVITYINEHYPEELSLQSVGRAFYISSAYLSSVFKKSTGFTLIEYINQFRIIQAQKLLRETDKKVLYIAQEVGFRSIAHFGRVFKEVTAMTPIQYRRESTE